MLQTKIPLDLFSGSSCNRKFRYINAVQINYKGQFWSLDFAFFEIPSFLCRENPFFVPKDKTQFSRSRKGGKGKNTQIVSETLCILMSFPLKLGFGF